MSIATTFLNDGMRYILPHGNQVLVKLINYTTNEADFDDVLVQTLTGSTYVSGLIFPIKSKMGSSEALLMEQGKLKTQDKVLYTGSCQVNTSGLVINIGTEYYTMIPDGVQKYTIGNSIIYQKMYIRQTLPGSLF
jgi:hypothetical protein